MYYHLHLMLLMNKKVKNHLLTLFGKMQRIHNMNSIATSI